MTFIFGEIVVGHPTDSVVWWFGVVAMLINLGEEIAADAMDVEGDRLIGSRSLAIVLGPRRALAISAGILCVVVLISVIPFLCRWLEPIYLLPIVLMDATQLLFDRPSDGSAIRESTQMTRWIYLGALASILIFISMRLVLQ